MEKSENSTENDLFSISSDLFRLRSKVLFWFAFLTHTQFRMMPDLMQNMDKIRTKTAPAGI